MSLVLRVAVAEPPQSASLLITITQSRRVKPNEVELHITIRNELDHDVYLPSRGRGESLDIDTLDVFQWNEQRGWIRLGGGTELSPANAYQLQPGQSISVDFLLQDPILTPLPNEGIPVFKGQLIPLHGKHKIRVGFYGSKEEWQAYRSYVEHFSKRLAQGKKSGAAPELKFADSADFEMPEAKSR